MNLFDRTIAYLKRQDDWVKEYTIQRLAKENHYSIKAIDALLQQLKMTPNVGYKSYCYKVYKTKKYDVLTAKVLHDF